MDLIAFEEQEVHHPFKLNLMNKIEAGRRRWRLFLQM
jgi:hypothetical protein